MKRLTTLGATALGALFASHCFAVLVTVVDAKFGRSELDLQQFDGAALRGTTPRGPAEIAARDVVLIERPSARPAADAKAMQIVLRGGERLTGRATGFANDVVTWTVPALGPREVPLAQIAEVVHVGESGPPTLSADELTRDALLLANGDRASGIITAMDATGVTIQSADGQPLSVEWSGIRRIHLADAGAAPPAPANWRLSLTDGTVCDVDKLTIQSESAVLVAGARQNRVSLDQIRAIENLAGKAKLLTRAVPTSREYAPFFPRTTGQETMDVPEEIAVGDGRSRMFVAVRPYSRITWTIEPGAKVLKTRFAVGSTGNLANCQARIWLDGRKVFDQANLTGSSGLGSFETPVGDATTVTLEVDFGENFDVQDQFYWVEPALVGE